MDPTVNNKVPILRLCSLHLSPNEPIPPSQQFQSYLGILLNTNFRFISACISDNICYIWSRRAKENEDISLQNIAQTKIFKKIISLLRSDKPLGSISGLSDQKYNLEIQYFPPPESRSIRNVECRAKLIVAIFKQRVMEKQSSLIRCYRDILASTLEWHMNEFFKEEPLLQLSTSSCSTLEEVCDPMFNLSPRGRLIKKPSQSNLHRLMHSFEKKHETPSFTCSTLKGLSMDCIDYCRSYWLGLKELEMGYAKLIGLNFLEMPKMGLLIEEEVARDIRYDLVGERLAHDIARSILDLSFIKKITSQKSVTKYHSVLFHAFLKHLMKGLNFSESKESEISNKWDMQVKKAEAEKNNDLLSYAIMHFFNDDLNQKGADENMLSQLLILMRQRMYVVPMSVIMPALREFEMKMENHHPLQEMSYNFQDHSLNFQVSRIASYKKDAKKNKDCPSFQLVMKNDMSASLNNLDVWTSSITIQLSLSEKKNLSKYHDLLNHKVCDPLQKLGFSVKTI